MRHAVGAFFVFAGAVSVPVGGLHQLFEGLGIAFAEQVAGLLPAENVAGRHAPRRAFVVLIAGQEIQEQAGMHEIPLLALAERKHVAEQLLARNEAAHDLADVLVDQRLAAGDRHHRRATFVGGIPAFLRRHAAIEDRVRIVDLAAADAGQVAAKQRLEHQHQRIALPAKQFLLDQILTDAQLLEERYCHYKFSFWPLGREVSQPTVSSAGGRNSIFSSRPGSTDTATGPIRRKASITSSTSTSGAEAPAVMPTALASFSQSGFSSLPSAMR